LRDAEYRYTGPPDGQKAPASAQNLRARHEIGALLVFDELGTDHAVAAGPQDQRCATGSYDAGVDAAHVIRYD
jgi:hypothetical protein